MDNGVELLCDAHTMSISKLHPCP